MQRYIYFHTAQHMPYIFFKKPCTQNTKSLID